MSLCDVACFCPCVLFGLSVCRRRLTVLFFLCVCGPLCFMSICLMYLNAANFKKYCLSSEKSYLKK